MAPALPAAAWFAWGSMPARLRAPWSASVASASWKAWSPILLPCLSMFLIRSSRPTPPLRRPVPPRAMLPARLPVLRASAARCSPRSAAWSRVPTTPRSSACVFPSAASRLPRPFVPHVRAWMNLPVRVTRPVRRRATWACRLPRPMMSSIACVATIPRPPVSSPTLRYAWLRRASACVR